MTIVMQGRIHPRIYQPDAPINFCTYLVDRGHLLFRSPVLTIAGPEPDG